MGSRLVPAGRRLVSGERAYPDHLLSGPALSADLYRICSQKDQGESLWEWLKTSLIMAACVVLAVLPNAQGMYSNWDLGQHSIRGASELTPKPDASGKVEKASTGLDKVMLFNGVTAGKS